MEHKAQKFGCYIVIPLKYEDDDLLASKMEATFSRCQLNTPDLTETVKDIFGTHDTAMRKYYEIPKDTLLNYMCPKTDFSKASSFTITNDETSYSFDFYDSCMYVFRTKIAFMCLGVSFDHMEALDAICNPGYADSAAVLSFKDENGKQSEFSLEDWIMTFCQSFGLKKFFDHSTFLIDYYTHTLLLRPDRYQTLDEIKQITFNMHLMVPVDQEVEDESEEDVRYVFAVKDQKLGSYRWGCCVTSQTTSYAVADPDMDFGAEMEAQKHDNLPVTILALYEKYTCLRFTQLIANLDISKKASLKSLKKLMLEFRAYGTVIPANLSRWHNVKQVYVNLMEVGEIQTAMDEINDKISILSTHQNELIQSRNEAFVNIITSFGIISILASVLTIIQILDGGGILFWHVTFFTIVAIVLIMVVTLKKK